MRASKWSIFNEYPYLDSDEGKIRTIDLRATKVSITQQNKENPFITVIELLVECKKSVNEAWVFHVAGLTDLPESYNILISKRMALEVTKIPSKRKNEDYTCFERIPLTYSQSSLEHKIALSNQVIGGKDLLFEAYMQLIKSLIDCDRQAKDSDKQIKGGKDYPYCEFQVIPLIVFDGAMFECYYKDNQLVTPRTNFVRSIVNIIPSQKMPALIDVVSLDTLPQYIQMIENEFPRKNLQVK